MESNIADMKKLYIKAKEDLCNMCFDEFFEIALNEENKAKILAYCDTVEMMLSSIIMQLNSKHQLLDLDKAFKSKDVRSNIDYLCEETKNNMSKYSIVDIANIYPYYETNLLLNILKASNYKNPVGALLHTTESKVKEFISKVEICNDCADIGKSIMLINLYISDILYILMATKKYFYNQKLISYFDNEVNGLEILIQMTDEMIDECKKYSKEMPEDIEETLNKIYEERGVFDEQENSNNV